MKRSGVIAIVMLLAASAAGFVLGSIGRQSGTPRAASKAAFVGFEPKEIDLGERMWGQVVDFELKFVNRSSAAIQLLSARSSCDCTVIDEKELAGRTVAAGATLLISGRMSTQKEPGPKLRTITITDTSENQYSADVAVDVQGTWTLSHSSIDFGEIYLDAPPPRLRATFRAGLSHFIPPWIS